MIPTILRPLPRGLLLHFIAALMVALLIAPGGALELAPIGEIGEHECEHG